MPTRCKPGLHLCITNLPSTFLRAAQVWDVCEAAKKAPLDNKTSIFKHMASAIAAISDAAREVGLRRLALMALMALISGGSVGWIVMITCDFSRTAMIGLMAFSPDGLMAFHLVL